MSWLTEFAGKAEDFLNKIDKNAATALNTTGTKEKETRPKKSEPFIEPQPESEPLRTNYSPPTPSVEPASYTAPVTATQVNENSSRNGHSSKKSRKKPQKPAAEVKASVVNGSPEKPVKSTPIPEKASDDDLINYLNDSSAVNESLILKDEVEMQARELKLITKNYRSLQKDYDDLSKKLQLYQEKLTQSETARDSNQAEERDLRRLLSEKDSQLTDLTTRHETALETLRKLELSQENLSKLDHCLLENSQLKSENNELLQRLEKSSGLLETSESHVASMKTTLASMEKEFANYQEKAKSILAYKDELISNLKGASSSGGDSSEGSPPEELVAQITSLKNERELLQADLSQTRALVTSLKDDNLRLEKDLQNLRYINEELQQQLSLEKTSLSGLQTENLQLSQQLSSINFELERERTERSKSDHNLAQLKRQSTTEVRNGHVAQEEIGEVTKLKTRVAALSQSLYEKQSLINDLTTDKQLLQIEVERVKRQVKEGGDGEYCSAQLPQTVIASQPLYLSESPWDSHVSAKMKRMYGQLDAVFCQFGLALRRRPNLRLGMSLYVIFLHLWVFFVLFSWMHHATPE